MEALDELTTGWRHHWVRGMRAFGKGRFAEAVKEYRTAVALDPKNPIPLTDLGSALARMGDLKGAVREYAQALRASPGNPMLHYYLGTTLMGLQSEEEAAKHYQRAIGANPGFMRRTFSWPIFSCVCGVTTTPFPTTRPLWNSIPGSVAAPRPVATRAGRSDKWVSWHVSCGRWLWSN